MSKEMKRYEYPEDFWLWEELDELDAELEASGIEDATAWERWDEMESVLMTLAERYTWHRNNTREQYEANRKRLIAEGEDPRCIMSYSECMAYDLFQAELEREREVDTAWDEFELWDEWDETDFEYGDELDFDAEQLVEMVDEMQEASMVELEQFGCIEFEPQFNWHAKSTPDDRGWSRAVIDIIAFEGEDAEPLFELF